MITFLNIIELFNLLIFFNNEKCFQKIITQKIILFNMEILGNEYHFIVLIIIFKMMCNISDFLISELKYPASKFP